MWPQRSCSPTVEAQLPGNAVTVSIGITNHTPAGTKEALIAAADTLQGAFTFQKKAPDMALVYFSEDTSLSPDSAPVLDQKDKEFTPQ